MADQPSIDLRNLANVQQNGVQAINAVAKAIQDSFPQATGISGSSGGATGTYLTIIAPDGNAYKIALRSP